MVSLRVPPQAAVGTTNEIALEVQPYLNTPSGEFVQIICFFLPGRLQSWFATVVLDGGLGPPYLNESFHLCSSRSNMHVEV